MHPEQTSLFRNDVSTGVIETRLQRLENKLDRLISLLEEREGSQETTARGGIFEGIYDNLRYPVTYFYDTYVSLRPQAPEAGAFTRL